jgi:very-short-patch-repair endonuclease
MKHFSTYIDGVQSPIEAKLQEAMQEFELKPVPQYKIGAYFVDFAFPEKKLVIEADGKDFHKSSRLWERDKHRQSHIESLGWEFERFSGSFIHKYADTAAAKIALRYFSDTLTKEQKAAAVQKLVHYFAITGEPELAFALDEFIHRPMPSTA